MSLNSAKICAGMTCAAGGLLLHFLGADTQLVAMCHLTAAVYLAGTK